MKKLHKKLPFKKVHLPENPAILLPLHAVVTVLVVESICRHSLIAGILFLFQHPYSFLVNALIVGCSYSLALLFRKQKSLLVLFTLFWLTLGIINGVILTFRVTPFTSSDLLLLKDGVNVASKYLSLLALAALVALLVLVIVVLAVLAFRIPEVKKRPKLPYSVTAILCTFLAAWGLRRSFWRRNSGNFPSPIREMVSFTALAPASSTWASAGRRSIPPRPSRG